MNSQKQGSDFENIFRDFLSDIIPQLGYEFIHEPETVPTGLQDGFDVYSEWKNPENNMTFNWKFECKSHIKGRSTTIPNSEIQKSFSQIEEYSAKNVFNCFCIVAPNKKLGKGAKEKIKSMNERERFYTLEWTNTQNRLKYLFSIFGNKKHYEMIYSEKVPYHSKNETSKAKRIGQRIFEENNRKSIYNRVLVPFSIFSENFINSQERSKRYFKDYIKTSFFNEFKNDLENFLTNTNVNFFLIYGITGIGKTRLLIEFFKSLNFKKNIHFYFLLGSRLENGILNVDKLRNNFLHEKNNVLIIDDIHKIRNIENILTFFNEGLINKIIGLTWNNFVDVLKSKLGSNTIVKEIGLIDDYGKIEEFFKSEIGIINSQHIKYLVKITEGHPILIVTIGSIIKNDKIGMTFKEILRITKDDIIKNLWIMIKNELIANNISSFNISDLEKYLSSVYLFQPFSSESEIDKKMKNIFEINNREMGVMLEILRDNGTIEWINKRILLYPDLLGTFLVEKIFFNNFSTKNLDEIENIMDTSEKKIMFKNLMAIGSDECRSFLMSKIERIRYDIMKKDSQGQLELLKLLDNFVYWFPSETLQILKKLLFIENDKIEICEFKSNLDKILLNESLRLLKEIIRNPYINPEISINILFCVIENREEIEAIEKLKNNAKEILENLSLYSIDYYEIKKEFPIQKFIIQNLKKLGYSEANFEFIKNTCHNLLSTRIESISANVKAFSIRFGHVPAVNDIKYIREETIKYLFNIYDSVVDQYKKIDIIEILKFGIISLDGKKFSSTLKKLMSENIRYIIGELDKRIQNEKSLIVLFELNELFSFLLKRYKQKFKIQIVPIIKKIENVENYKLYKLLFKPFHWELKNIENSELTKIVKKINKENMSAWRVIFNMISDNLPLNEYAYGFHGLLRLFGKFNFVLAIKFINKTKVSDSVFQYLYEIVKGIFESKHPEKGFTIIDNWIISENNKYLIQIPKAIYGDYDEKISKVKIKKLDLLINHAKLNSMFFSDNNFDIDIFVSLLGNYKADKKNGELILRRLFDLVKEESLLTYIANLISHNRREEINILKLTKQTLKVVLEKMLHLKHLGHSDQEFLGLIMKKDVLLFFSFFKKRIKKGLIESRKIKMFDIDRFSVIPFKFDYGRRLIINSKKYDVLLDKIFVELILNKEWWYNYHGKRLIESISPNLDKKLHEFLYIQIETNEKKKIIGVIDLLKEYNGSPIIDDLCIKCIKKYGDDDEIIKNVSSAFMKTGVVSGEEGMLNTYRTKLDRIKEWNSENFYVKNFIKNVISNLKERIKFEEIEVNNQKKLYRKYSF